MNSKGIFKSRETLPLVMPPDENDSLKLRILGLAKTVRLLAVTDCVFYLVYMFYFSFWFILSLIPAMLGYYGTKNFEPKVVTFYALSLILNCFFRGLEIIYSPSYSMFFFNVIMFFFQLYFINLVTTFINELRTLDNELISHLRQGWQPRVITFIYY